MTDTSAAAAGRARVREFSAQRMVHERTELYSWLAHRGSGQGSEKRLENGGGHGETANGAGR